MFSPGMTPRGMGCEATALAWMWKGGTGGRASSLVQVCSLEISKSDLRV